MTAGDRHGDGLEIERKWRLTAMPEHLLRDDSGLERMRIRQGYLALPSDRDFEAFDESGPDDVPTVGRIRSIIDPDGGRPATFIHTLKIGSGLVRREKERPLTEEAFEAAWPSTVGRRLEKVRWRVPDGGLVWEIDRFDDLSDLSIDGSSLVIAEVELPDPEGAMDLRVPPWLAGLVDREVTDDPAYNNAEIAFRTTGR